MTEDQPAKLTAIVNSLGAIESNTEHMNDVGEINQESLEILLEGIQLSLAALLVVQKTPEEFQDVVSAVIKVNVDAVHRHERLKTRRQELLAPPQD